MNERDDNQNEVAAGSGAQDSVATAIRLAGPRETPPQADRERIFAAASASLKKKQAERLRIRSRRIGLAIAATVVLSISAGLLLQTPAPQMPAQARVDRIAGQLEWQQADAGDWRPARENDPLEIGTLRTNETSRAGIVLANGVSVRLAANTAVSLVTADKLRLGNGKIYVDAGTDLNTSVEVITPAGTARDIGTQFEIQYREPEFRLRIREGRVAFAGNTQQLLANAGDEVTVDTDGNINQRAMPVADQDWLWAEEIAPVPDLDGEPLSTLLDWVSRETGRQISFASEDVAVQADATVLHGSISKMSPLETLRAMLSTTNFGYRLQEDGTILIYAAR